MNKIRIAQIGSSRYSHGEDIFAALKQAQDTFEVVGFAFPENEREKFPERMAAFEGSREMTLEEILNDPAIDAVAVETEEKYLTKYALLAAEHGKHIHIEKPGGTDPEAFEKLISTVKSKNIVFHIGYMYRYNPVISRVIREARAGEYGKIVSVDAQMSCTHPVAMRTWLKELDGGMMFFLGCHLVDLVLRIKGSPNRIIPLNKSTGTDGIDCTDFGMAAFEYDTGVSVIKTCVTELGGFSRRSLVICGDKKTVEVRPLEMFSGNGPTDLYAGVTEYSERDWTKPGIYSKSENFDRYLAMMTAFGKMAAGEADNPFTPDYEHELYKTVLKCCGR